MMLKLVLGLLAIEFAALTAVVVYRHGYLGFFQILLSDLVGRQAFVDLSIALGLAIVWMWRDARQRGQVVLPYIATTLVFGSLGPLLYLLLRGDPEGLEQH